MRKLHRLVRNKVTAEWQGLVYARCAVPLGTDNSIWNAELYGSQCSDNTEMGVIKSVDASVT